MSNSIPALLAANIGDIIWAIMALLIPVLYVVKHIADAAKQGPGEAAPAAAREPQPQQNPQRPVQQAGQQADPLRSQVEEFLRRAGREPGGDQGRGPQAPPAATHEIELLIDDDPQRQERRPLAEPLRPIESREAVGSEPNPAPQPIPAKSNKPRQPRRPAQPRQQRKSLGEHQAERTAARSQLLAQQGSYSSPLLIVEDQHLDVHVKARFGMLAGRAVVAAEDAPAASESPAVQIAAMLASPEGVRQAIVVNEILRRPDDRW